MILLLLLAVGGIGFYVYSQGSSALIGTVSTVTSSNLMGWPDVMPENQGGTFKGDYDDKFLQVSQEENVPFALLKAHSIRESSLNPTAYHADTSAKASYGLMQVEWWASSNRFANWGYSDDTIGDGSILYDPYVSIKLGAKIIKDNYSRLKSLRDCINAYNTGAAESVREAPANYVDDVLGYYSQLVNGAALPS